MTKNKDVDAFIARYPQDVQVKLEKIRQTIRRVAPAAEEIISYGIPTFRTPEGNLVHYAAYAHHIGFYPGASGIRAFKKDLAPYKSAKGSVQFPLERPVPFGLIAKIVKYRIKENFQKAKVK